MGDRGQPWAVGLSHRVPGGAVKSRVFEGLFFRLAGRAKCGLISLSVGGLCRKIALASPQLVDARGLEFAQSHERVWFPRDWVFVGGRGEKVRPFGKKVFLE